MIEKYKYNTLKEVPDSAVNIEIQILNPSSNKAKEMNREGKLPEQAFKQINRPNAEPQQWLDEE